MKTFLSKTALAGVALIATLLPALAQVNATPSPGYIQGYRYLPTFSAVSIGLVPAASATDVFCIAGSATKTVSVTRFEVSGVAGTLTSVSAVLLRRATVNTGGTAALTTAAPNLTQGPHDSGTGAGTATLIAYTANPTITDTSPVYQRARYLTLPTVAAAASAPPITWIFGDNTNTLDNPIVIRGAAQQLCLNLNGGTVSSGLLNINIEWTEQ